MLNSGNKSKINTDRAIVVPFTSYTNRNQTTSLASIYVPFLVSEIQIRGIHTNFDADFREMYFTSSLVDGGPLGSAFAGILGDTTASSKTVKYGFHNPREINGAYDLTFYLIDPLPFFSNSLFNWCGSCYCRSYGWGFSRYCSE